MDSSASPRVEVAATNGSTSSDPPLGELRDLATLLAHRTVARAATAAGVSDGALRQSVRRLQKHLGVKLLSGAKHGPALTEAGVVCAQQAAEIVRQFDEMCTSVGSAAADTHTINVACSPVHVATALAYVATYHKAKWPNTAVNLQQTTDDPGRASQLLYEKLRRNEVDLAMGGPSRADFKSEIVYTAPLKFFPAPTFGNGRRRAKSVRLVDLEKHGDPIVAPTQDFFTRLTLESEVPDLNIVADSRSAATLLALRDAGHGSAIVSSDGLLFLSTAEEGLSVVGKDGRACATEVFLHANRNPPPHRQPAISEFFDSVKDFRRQIGQLKRRPGSRPTDPSPSDFRTVFESVMSQLPGRDGLAE